MSTSLFEQSGIYLTAYCGPNGKMFMQLSLNAIYICRTNEDMVVLLSSLRRAAAKRARLDRRDKLESQAEN